LLVFFPNFFTNPEGLFQKGKKRFKTLKVLNQKINPEGLSSKNIFSFRENIFWFIFSSENINQFVKP